MSTIKTSKEILELMKKEGVEVVDLRFMDFPGLWQHFSIPARELAEDTFESGLGFDGSSIRGWQAINESDMLVKPVPETAFIDPFLKHKTLVMISILALRLLSNLSSFCSIFESNDSIFLSNLSILELI